MKSNNSSSKKPLKIQTIVISSLLVIASIIFIAISGLYIANVYTLTPSHIRKPVVDHYHLRMQLFVDGEYIDFSADKFQEPYEAGQCDESLPISPIHFHDNKDQYIHIHWDGITGGEVLKNYGINRIDGLEQGLGYRTDLGIIPQKVKIHGNIINDTKKTIFIYQVEESGEIRLRNTQEFLNQDLETFFGIKSSISKQREEAELLSFLPNFTPTVFAHDGGPKSSSKSEAELKKLNDVLGDLIVFIQDEEPTQDDVLKHVDNFVELDESTCGG